MLIVIITYINNYEGDFIRPHKFYLLAEISLKKTCKSFAVSCLVLCQKQLNCLTIKGKLGYNKIKVCSRFAVNLMRLHKNPENLIFIVFIIKS